METRQYYPEGETDELNKKGSLTETQKHEIERLAVDTLAEWSKMLDAKGIKLNEKDLINADFVLESSLKKLVQTNSAEKNDLYVSFLLKMLNKGIEAFDGRATKRTRDYLEDIKDDYHIPGMEKELVDLN